MKPLFKSACFSPWDTKTLVPVHNHRTFTFTSMHLVNAFIQSDLPYIALFAAHLAAKLFFLLSEERMHVCMI